MSVNERYKQGYAAGYHGTEPSWDQDDDEQFMMGHADGVGDREAGVEAKGVQSAFIGENFYETNDPPEGYTWQFVHDTPQKGEVYLTKAGNAGVAKSDPKNGRKRHLLDAIQPCRAKPWYDRGSVRHDTECKFCVRHSGKHSWDLIK